MEVAEDVSRIKVIYWVVTLVPIVLLNLSPYLGISFSETIDNDETYYKLVLGFSLVFILFLLGIFSSYKCWVYSEIIPTKIISSLLLVLYLILVVAMVYFFLSGYLWSPVEISEFKGADPSNMK